jgi:hypothetical protein
MGCGPETRIDMNGNNTIWTLVGILLICVLILLLTGRIAM